MIHAVYQKAFAMLKTKPVRLWGISLLSLFLTGVACAGFIGIPAVSFVLVLALQSAMNLLFLRAYRKERVETEDLFATFTKERFFHVVGGMAWMYLWVVLWALIPIVGVVFAVIKLYTYRFVPYILLTRPEVKATEAIKVSERETAGYRGKMFLAELLFWGVIVSGFLVLSALAWTPFLGWFFALADVALALAVWAFGGLILGLLQAIFYDEVQRCKADPSYRAQYFPPAPQGFPYDGGPQAQGGTAWTQPGPGGPQEPSARQGQTPPSRPAPPTAEPEQGDVTRCPVCNTPVARDSKFCYNCGTEIPKNP